jgi:type II secretory pathway component HofQ
MRTLLVALSILAARDAHGDDRALAGRDLCARGARRHGAPIDLDVKDADIRDVFRLIADAGHANLVVSDDVTGKLTLHLRRVAWESVACAVAAVHHLTITVHDNILLVMRPAR